ncbi:glycoside hydrolase family 55 protein [Paludibacterium sp. B53371]|uniref:glycoside hydrolase family 55 protein n=1 Tax=Paludibacterium sp. B53371 TaxID=2806263 RepID=UPI001C0503C4|nr:glycoside hydrolase family 55 protein [Paludibacterium sp. B53371]
MRKWWLVACLLGGVLNLQEVWAAQCGSETMPVDRGALRCALDLGVVANADEDQREKIMAALTTAASQHEGVYFPSGVYRIEGDLVLGSYMSMVGSEAGLTIFRSVSTERSPKVGEQNYSVPVTDLTIRDMVFDNVVVDFYGNRKARIAISHDAFLNTVGAEQLSVAHVPYQVIGNVFMRDSAHPGSALSTYRNVSTLIEGNYLGDAANQAKAAAYLDSETDALITRIQASARAGGLVMLPDQGNFINGWYATDGLSNSTFRRNFFAGNDLPLLLNPLTGKYELGRDHNVYIKQYNNVDVYQNYFAGWPDDESGGLKFRNAQGLTFAANYLDHISVVARSYDNSATMLMDDSYFFNNQIERGGIGYWQNFTDTADKHIEVKDFLVFDNLFDAMDDHRCRVSTTNRNIGGEFLANFASNHFADGLAVPECDFTDMPLDQLVARLPESKRVYLTMQPIQPGA